MVVGRDNDADGRGPGQRRFALLRLQRPGTQMIACSPVPGNRTAHTTLRGRAATSRRTAIRRRYQTEVMHSTRFSRDVTQCDRGAVAHERHDGSQLNARRVDLHASRSAQPVDDLLAVPAAPASPASTDGAAQAPPEPHGSPGAAPQGSRAASTRDRGTCSSRAGDSAPAPLR